MPFNSQTTRDDAAALIPEEVSAEIIKNLAETSWLFQLGRRLPDLARAQLRMPVASALATAYFVTGDTGLKQTTEVAWENKYIDAEEIAAIVPISSAVLDDADYDIWGEVRPALEEAFNVAISGAVLYGTNIPATWTTNLGAAGLLARATAAGQVASLGDFTDFYEAVEGETADGEADGVLMLLEADGFGTTGHVADISVRGAMRNCRDSNGQRIYTDTDEVGGAPILYPLDGSMVSASSLMISGDWRQLVYAVRQDISYTLATEAVITDAGGNIVYNLFEQDMVALRAVMRLGVALPNPINRMDETALTRCAFAVLTA